MLEYKIPIKTVSETNRRDHWRVSYKRHKEQREMANVFSQQWYKDLPPKPWVITLIRGGARRLDVGNLAAAMKSPQDGICDAFGIDDGDVKHSWSYDQEPGQKEPYVKVRIETR